MPDVTHDKVEQELLPKKKIFLNKKICKSGSKKLSIIHLWKKEWKLKFNGAENCMKVSMLSKPFFPNLCNNHKIILYIQWDFASIK